MSNAFKYIGAGLVGAAAVALVTSFNEPAENTTANDQTCTLGIATAEDRPAPYVADFDADEIVSMIENRGSSDVLLLRSRMDSFRTIQDNDAKVIYEALVERLKIELENIDPDSYGAYMQTVPQIAALIDNVPNGASPEQASEDLEEMLELYRAHDLPEYFSTYSFEDLAVLYYAKNFANIAENYQGRIYEVASENPSFFQLGVAILAQQEETKDLAVALVDEYLSSGTPDMQQVAIKAMGRTEYSFPGTFRDFDSTLERLSNSANTFIANEAQNMAYTIERRQQEDEPQQSVVLNCE